MDAPPRLPFPRDGILDVAPLYDALRREAPVSRVLTPAGDPAWLVTRYDAARMLFADPRLGRTHPAPESASRVSASPVMGGPMGAYDTERADHARWRGLMAPSFSARRMTRLAARVQEILDGLVDDMVAEHDGTGGPVDLHSHVAAALPVEVIGELLGVPPADRPTFRALSLRATAMSGDDPMAAMGELFAFGTRLAATKRAHPGEDVVSDVVAGVAAVAGPPPTDEEVAGIAAALLFAGHETTLTRIDLGVLLLLEHPSVADALRADPAHADAVTEEVLRLAAPGGVGLLRYAHTDVEVPGDDGGGGGGGGIVIPAGDAVVLSSAAANRDPRAFADPATFVPGRGGRPHLAFGHGPHFCIGAALARIELRAALTTLVTRLPGLGLAVDRGELSLHADRFTGGLDALPVTW